MAQAKICSSRCKFFKCGKKSAIYRRHNVWCRWADEMCNVVNCTYAICIKRRYLPGGICGETVKRKTVEKEPEEVVGPAIKLRGKTLRKIREKELF